MKPVLEKIFFRDSRSFPGTLLALFAFIAPPVAGSWASHIHLGVRVFTIGFFVGLAALWFLGALGKNYKTAAFILLAPYLTQMFVVYTFMARFDFGHD